MSTVKFNTWQNTDGTENYKCRAWVNFNGIGTVAIRASGNVSSITDNGTGYYTVNFTTAMPDINYSLNVTASGSAALAQFYQGGTPSATTGAPIYTMYTSSLTGGGNVIDAHQIYVAVFR